MSNKPQTSQPVSKSESAENRRTTPKIFMAAMAIGVVAIGAVLTVGAKFVFH